MKWRGKARGRRKGSYMRAASMCTYLCVLCTSDAQTLFILDNWICEMKGVRSRHVGMIDACGLYGERNAEAR